MEFFDVMRSRISIRKYKDIPVEQEKIDELIDLMRIAPSAANRQEWKFVAMKDGKKCFIQVAYLLSSDDVIEREFGAFDSVRDPSPKYVFSLDEYDMSKDGITHYNIEEWLLSKVNITLS